MSIFSKPTYEEKFLEFKSGLTVGDKEAGMVNIEAYGNIMGEDLYFYIGYSLNRNSYHDGTYEKILNILNDYNNKKLKITLKIKNNKVKNFKLDLDYLANLYQCEDLKKLEPVGWGINKKSIYEE